MSGLPLRQFAAYAATLLASAAAPVKAQTVLPEIVVEAPPPAVGGNTDYSSSAVVAPNEALSKGATSLGDMLGTKPGVSQTAFAPAASRPVIRGLGGFRVRTQENGVSTQDMANLGEDHAVAIDPLLAGQVEVIRGPATLRYGSQAIGGVVSANNSRIPETVPANGTRFETRGAYNSVSDGKEGAALFEAGGKNFVIHADGFERKAADYAIPGGKQPNSSLFSEGYAIGGSYVFNDGFIGAAYQSNTMTYYIPGIASTAEKNHIDLWQSKWTSRGEWRLRENGIEAIKYWFGATDYLHHEVDVLHGATVIGSIFKNREMEARMEISHLPMRTALGELRGVLGLQWGDRKLSVTGIEELLAPAHVKSAAVFMFEEFQLTDRLKFQAAGRLDNIAVTGGGATFPANFLPPPNAPTEFAVNRNFRPTSASVGLLYTLQWDMTARITAQHVERAPDPIEMFYKGPHDTPRTFEIGDPAMQLERANTFELGLKRTHGNFRFEGSLYRTEFTNFIFKNFTGIKCGNTFATCGTPAATFDQIIYSQRDADFYGAELQAEYDVSSIWRGVWGIEGQYDFVHAKFKDGSYVPKIPPHRVGGGVYYRDQNWSAKVFLLHAFGQNNLGAFETPTSGYNLLNAELSYTRRFDRSGVVPEMTLGVRGENLLNDNIRLHQSYKKDEVLQPGLNVRVFASAKLQ